jgi:hypothetical protein
VGGIDVVLGRQVLLVHGDSVTLLPAGFEQTAWQRLVVS